MVERDQNKDTGKRLEKLKKDLMVKEQMSQRYQQENEELIERVAKAESTIEQREEEVQVLQKKKMDQKFLIEQLKDKIISMQEVLERSELTKQDEVKQMEARIESRVAKIIL